MHLRWARGGVLVCNFTSCISDGVRVGTCVQLHIMHLRWGRGGVLVCNFTASFTHWSIDDDGVGVLFEWSFTSDCRVFCTHRNWLTSTRCRCVDINMSVPSSVMFPQNMLVWNMSALCPSNTAVSCHLSLWSLPDIQSDRFWSWTEAVWTSHGPSDSGPTVR